MKNVVEALLIVWPRGIPANEYERALSLAAKFGALAPSLRVAVAEEPKKVVLPAKKAPQFTKRIGEPGLRKIREALSTGPATTTEIQMVTGLSSATVWNGLQICGEVVEKRFREGQRGSPTFVYGLKKGA